MEPTERSNDKYATRLSFERRSWSLGQAISQGVGADDGDEANDDTTAPSDPDGMKSPMPSPCAPMESTASRGWDEEASETKDMTRDPLIPAETLVGECTKA